MDLTEYLQTQAKLSAEVAQTLDELFESHDYPKGYKLVKEDSRSQKLFYVEKGIMRGYYFKDGKDITHHFFFEKDIFASIETIFLNQQQYFNVELLEDCTIRAVDYSKIEKLIETNTKLQQFQQFIMTSIILELAEHIRSIQFQSAQERYNLLMEKSPDLLLRVPLGHIASYLGITQQTLSVIRARK